MDPLPVSALFHGGSSLRAAICVLSALCIVIASAGHRGAAKQFCHCFDFRPLSVRGSEILPFYTNKKFAEIEMVFREF
jgi:hypothetical protein